MSQFLHLPYKIDLLGIKCNDRHLVGSKYMLVFFSFLTVGPLGQPWSAFPEAESQDRAASEMSGKPGHEAEVAQESLL